MFSSQYQAQLAALASQHHTSDYNRAKYGLKGCPVPYVPLSVQMPEQFRDLRRRQESYGLPQSWWPCDAVDEDNLAHFESVVIGSTKLEQALTAAMDAPLESNAHVAPSNDPLPYNLSIKTSSSHPINVSCVIPIDLVPLISSHLVLASSHDTIPVLELPSQFYLDRLVNSCALSQARAPFHINHDPPNNDTYLQHDHLLGPLPPTVPQSGPVKQMRTVSSPKMHIRTRSSMSQAMQAAINTGLSMLTPTDETPSPLSVTPGRFLADKPFPKPLSRVTLGEFSDNALSQEKDTLILQHTNDSAVSLSLSLSLSVNPHSALSLDLDIYEDDHPSSTSARATPSALDGEADSESNRTADNRRMAIPPDPRTLLIPLDFPETATSTPVLTKISSHSKTSSPSPFVIGNLLMTSCPGKKVRLRGPVRGRSGVCRDLRADLQRIRALGVKCIVCCLDDAELDYLGAPWDEYREAAQHLGIDVLRIPIPEGLPPLDPPSLDKLITQLIDRYTINGAPALVHCRGGVGRAGVIACCWVAKLGLCGWLADGFGAGTDSNSISTASDAQSKTSTDVLETGVRVDTLSFVGRIIGLVRQRRSMKAVETYEQVRFLVDYVEYLRRRYDARVIPSV